MKVLFLMNTGFQTTSKHLLVSVIESLRANGNEVVVVKKELSEDETTILELEKLGVKVLSVKTTSPKKTNLIFRYLSELKFFKKCKKYIPNNFDSVFLQSSNVAMSAVKVIKSKNKKARIVFNVQDIFPYNAVYGGKLKSNGLIFKTLAKLQRKAYNAVDKIITISEDMKDTLIADGVLSSKIEVVYNWSYQDGVYDYNKIDFTNVSKIINKGYFNVVYAGNIGVMQNVDVIIETASLLKEDNRIWFYIIGNGVYRNKLELIAKERGIKNVTFTSMLNSQDAPSIYASADLNVIPLEKGVYKTALPSKTATCIACQKPIVFCVGKECKFAKFVEDNNACKVLDSRDAVGLKDEILSLLKNSNSCDNSNLYQTYFSKTNNSKKYVDIICGQ